MNQKQAKKLRKIVRQNGTESELQYSRNTRTGVIQVSSTSNRGIYLQLKKAYGVN
jgi:hypothetical protein